MSVKRWTVDDAVQAITFSIFVITFCVGFHALLVCKNKLTEIASEIKYMNFKLDGRAQSGDSNLPY